MTIMRVRGSRSSTHNDAPSSCLRLPSGQCLSLLLVLFGLIETGCSGASPAVPVAPPVSTPPAQVAAPVINTTPALNGAVIVSLAEAAANATVYYTTDGTAPTHSSAQYLAPFLVSSSVSVKAIGTLAGETDSTVANAMVGTNLSSGTLAWSDEFSNNTGSNIQPNPAIWGYDTGASGWGNAELEDYCAWGSSNTPCNPATPNAYIGTDGYLHISAQQPSAGTYTSARLKSQGLFSFQYGRIEFRALVPEAQGFWPAAWLLGNNIATAGWPVCGEMDVMERVDAATQPDFNVGSIHGPGFTGVSLGTTYHFPTAVTAATWHISGMIWAPGLISYYVDDPSKPYATYTPASLSGLNGARWSFDDGQANFIILNLAVGGQYPGSPTTATPFPSEVLVDYVRLYTN